MNWNTCIRQTHRWVSIAFTVTAIVNIVVMATEGGAMPPPWVTYSPLLPLGLLLLTGLYQAVEQSQVRGSVSTPRVGMAGVIGRR